MWQINHGENERQASRQQNTINRQFIEAEKWSVNLYYNIQAQYFLDMPIKTNYDLPPHPPL
jgi:hypothetical protein